MQRILLSIALVLYAIGCGTSEQNTRSLTQETNLSTTSSQKKPTIEATTLPISVDIMEIANVGVEGIALDIVISEDGRYAYVASGNQGLNILDIHDPYNPRLIGTYDTPEYVNHVELKEGIAYVSYVPQGLESYEKIYTFDVTKPTEVTFVNYQKAFLNTNHKIFVRGDLLFYVDLEGFRVIRKEDSKQIGMYSLFGGAYGFAIYNDFVFIANGQNGVMVLKLGVIDYEAVLKEEVN